MDMASKILILGGVVTLAYGLFLGIPIGMIRAKQATYSNYLRIAHVGAFMLGSMLLGLVFAIQLSSLSPDIETLAAVLMVVSAIFLEIKDTLNWLTGVDDEFGQRKMISLGLGTLASIGSLISIMIILVGVIQAF